MTIELFGTKIRLTFSFFAVITLMFLSAQERIVAVCLLSSLLHECGHLSLMYIFGEKPSEVVFGAFGIRIERFAVSTLSYKKEAVISLGGVIVNFILVSIFFLYFTFSKSDTALIGAFVNLFVASLNLMPVGVLDAGNFLRYILLVKYDEEKTGKVLSFVSDVTVLVFCVFCIFFTLFVSVNVSLIAVCVYLITINLNLFIERKKYDKQGN